MQFKHPEILYFLFALLIPILVHLFQLKRFKIQEFSNVAFLKEISLQTRKSSQLKKWLLLVCRLFLLACAIFAFAQPFFPVKNQNSANNHLVLVLDNSFSMQAKGSQGPLLSRSVQEILETFPNQKTFSLLTNNQLFWDVDLETLQGDIQKITYSAVPFNLNQTVQKINHKFPNQNYDLVVISDGTSINQKNIELKNTTGYFYKVSPQSLQNLAILNANLFSENPNFNQLEVLLKGFNVKDSIETILTISQEDKVYSKSKIWIGNSDKKQIVNLPKTSFKGKITIEDPYLTYDNVYYFTVKAQSKNKIGSIGNTNLTLSKIIPKHSADVESLSQIPSDIESYSCFIINEPINNLENIGISAKKAFDLGKQVVYIPNSNLNATAHQAFFKAFGNIKFTDKKEGKTVITNIHTSHPLFKEVFTKTPDNFEYPSTQNHYGIQGVIAPILTYANQEVFLGNLTNGMGNLYVFTSSLQDNDTNFTKSPIVVPTFYNMVMGSQTNNLQNFEIYSNQSLLVSTTVQENAPIILENKLEKGMPLQQPVGKNTKLIFSEFPSTAGTFSILQNNKELDNVSLNYERTESNLSLSEPDLFNNFAPVKNLDEVLAKVDQNRLGKELFKYFLLATLLFILLELLIQKFVK